MNSREKQVALLSLPSSGSTWLASQIVASTSLIPCEDDQYEFFHPVRNLKYEESLSVDFGSETVSGHENLSLKSFSEGTYKSTWGNEHFSFCKEVWSFNKVERFNELFMCIILTRSAKETFPPNRLRVYGWYDAIWNSMNVSRSVDPEFKRLLGIQRRSEIAHELATQSMIRSGISLGIPILNYGILVNGTPEQVRRELNQGWIGLPSTRDILDIDRLTENIIKTRKGQPRNSGGS